MKVPVRTFALVVAVLLLGCGGGSTGSNSPFAAVDPQLRESCRIEFIGGEFCCDPDGTFPQEIGTLRITHLGTPLAKRIRVTIGEFSGGAVVIDPDVSASADLEKDAVLDTKLYATDCNWKLAESTLLFQEYFAGKLASTSHQPVVLNNTCGPLDDMLALTELLQPQMIPTALLRDSARIAAVNTLVAWSGPHILPRIPLWMWIDLNRFGVFRAHLLDGHIQQAFGSSSQQKPTAPGKTGEAGITANGGEDFPCGSGPNGYTVCPSMATPLAEGDYVFAYVSAEEDIPLASSRYITYGFVFDGDGITTNNYVPHPSYPDDYFKDTDRWYTVDYDPATGWSLVCRDATNSVVTEVSTAARAIIRGNVILLVVAASEFAVGEPSYRVTAFTHTGDYGANPPHDWSGDQHPPVSEGLATFVRP